MKPAPQNDDSLLPSRLPKAIPGPRLDRQRTRSLIDIRQARKNGFGLTVGRKVSPVSGGKPAPENLS